MRVIAGHLGGRQFQSPHGHRTHPMSDKIRGALFNTLGDISSLTVLDAFAGSGALSFEAVSRGAKQVTAIDSDRSAQITIAANITALRLQHQVKLVKASANAWLSTAEEQFDLILCDPPYDDPQPNLLVKLADRTRGRGTAVFSLPPDFEIRLPGNFQLLATKNYGDSLLVFYRKIS